MEIILTMDIDELTKELSLQQANLEILQECLKHINDAIQSTDFFKNPEEITDLLKQVKECIDYVKNNIASLEELKKSLYSNVSIEDYETSSQTCQENLFTSTTMFHQFLLDYIRLTELPFASSLQESKNVDAKTQNTSTISSSDSKSSIELEEYTKPVLFISQKRNIVRLPYTKKELQYYLEKHKGMYTKEQLIKRYYTISLSHYKNAAISRFRETYNLMRKREKASIADSHDFALDLTFNGKIHPAVITACQNLEQLEYYLDCLELNELEKFDCFEVKFEISPYKK